MTITTDPDARALEVLPAAAALVCAVADEDADEIARVLTGVGDWLALAVVLAANVDPDKPIGATIRNLSDESQVGTILELTAATTGVSADLITSQRRDRLVLDARAVAMYACHRAGMTYSGIGRAFNRCDHTTARNAVGKVGANSRLRAIADSVLTAAGVEIRPPDEADRPEDRRKPAEVRCPGCQNRTRRAAGWCLTCDPVLAHAS